MKGETEINKKIEELLATEYKDKKEEFDKKFKDGETAADQKLDNDKNDYLKELRGPKYDQVYGFRGAAEEIRTLDLYSRISLILFVIFEFANLAYYAYRLLLGGVPGRSLVLTSVLCGVHTLIPIALFVFGHLRYRQWRANVGLVVAFAALMLVGPLALGLIFAIELSNLFLGLQTILTFVLAVVFWITNLYPDTERLRMRGDKGSSEDPPAANKLRLRRALLIVSVAVAAVSVLFSAFMTVHLIPQDRFAASPQGYRSIRYEETEEGYVVDSVMITIIDKFSNVDFGTLEIPSEYNGRSVVGIKDGAFSGVNNYSRISLPAGITQLSAEAFADCGSTEVEVVAGDDAVGALQLVGAFAECNVRTLRLSGRFDLTTDALPADFSIAVDKDLIDDYRETSALQEYFRPVVDASQFYINFDFTSQGERVYLPSAISEAPIAVFDHLSEGFAVGGSAELSYWEYKDAYNRPYRLYQVTVDGTTYSVNALQDLTIDKNTSIKGEWIKGYYLYYEIENLPTGFSAPSTGLIFSTTVFEKGYELEYLTALSPEYVEADDKLQCAITLPLSDTTDFYCDEWFVNAADGGETSFADFDLAAIRSDLSLRGRLYLNVEPVNLSQEDSFEYDGTTHSVGPTGLTRAEIKYDYSVTHGDEVSTKEGEDSLAQSFQNVKESGAYRYSVVAKDAQYQIASKEFAIDFSLFVTPRALSVVANAKAITYGDAPTNDGVRITGFANDETVEVLGGELDYAYSYEQYGHVSDSTYVYTITPQGYVSDNYAIEYVPGVLTVGKKPITVTIQPKISTYGDAQAALTATDNGIVNGDEGVYSLSCAVTAASGVGKYDVVGAALSPNYEITFLGEAEAYEVTKREIGIAWSDTALVYNGSVQKPTATATNIVNGDEVLLPVSGEQKNAGSDYDATAAFAAAQANYKLPTVVTAKFAIAEKPITVTIQSKSTTYGEAQAVLTATTDGIAEGDEGVYSLSCAVTATSGAGKYDIVGLDDSPNYAVTFVNGKDAYTVQRKTLTVTANAKAITYGDAPANDGVEITGFLNGETVTALGGELDYTYTYTQYGHVSDGSHNYTIMPKGYTSSNYAIEYAPGVLTVGRKAITVTIDPKASTYGEAQAALTATTAGIVNGDNDVYSLSCAVTTTSGAGTYDVVGAALSPNYTITFFGGTNAYEVTKREIGIAWSDTALVYNGSAQKPTATATNLANDDTVTLTVSGEQKNAGADYDATAAFAMGQANYKLPTVVTAKFAIAEKPITVTIDAKASTYGEAQAALTATTDGIVNGDSGVYSLSCAVTAASGAGKYDIVGHDDSPNYAVTFLNGTNAYTVNSKTLTVTAKAKAITYGDALSNDGVQITGFVNDETASVLGGELDYTYTYTQYGHVSDGSHNYIITPKGYTSANYAIEYVPGVLTVNKKPITVTIDPKASTYGNAQVSLTATTDGIVNDDSGVYSLSCDVTAASNAGTYDVVGAALSPNYEITFEGGANAYEVTKREIGIAWSNTALVYNGSAQKPTATATNLVNGDTVALTVGGEETNAGTNYDATAAFATAQANYKLPTVVTAKFAIAEKPITVTIDAKASTYGDAQVELTATDNGIVNGDEGVYSLACAVTATSGAGKYDILGHDDSTNYAVTFLNGTNAYTVNPKTLTVTAKAKAITYGDAPANDGVEITGFVNEQNASVLGGELDYTYTYEQYGQVSDGSHNYTITPKGYTSNNYAIEYVPGVLTVNKKPITVTIDPKESAYGDAPVALTATTDGIVNSDEGVYSLSCDVTAASGAGTYDITGTALNSNYAITFEGESNAYTVNPKTLTVTAKAKAITYGDAPANDGVQISGFVNDETVTALGGELDYTYTYTQYGHVSDGSHNYTIMPKGYTSDNYAIEYAPGVLMVNKKPITVTIDAKASTYGDAPMALTATTDGIVNGDKDVYSLFCAVTAASNAGTYNITGTALNSNYEITFEGESNAYTVNRKALTVTANAKAITYGDAPANDGVEITGFVNDETVSVLGGELDYTYTYEQYGQVSDDSHSYTITPKGYTSDNYAIEYAPGVLTVNKKPITVTIDAKASTYGETQAALTATTDGIVNGDEGVYSLSCAVTATSNAGMYNITGKALNSNYEITFEGGANAYEVTKREIGIEWSNTVLVYNGSAQKPTATATNLANGDTVPLTVSGEQTEVGTGYVATAAFADEQANYVLPAEVTTTFEIVEE